jgi:hypothetical protein
LRFLLFVLRIFLFERTKAIEVDTVVLVYTDAIEVDTVVLVYTGDIFNLKRYINYESYDQVSTCS